jgi:hypothetical protein
MFLIHHKLRSLSGMKILTFIKVIEFMIYLLNKFNCDYDVQLLSIVKQKKIKNKFLSFSIFLISLFLNYVALWSYMMSISIVLNDPNNFIIPLFMKLNFMDIKRSSKYLKEKKLIYVFFYEIHERFCLIFCLIMVMIQNYYENKINSHNFIDYFNRAGFVIFAEILFDWLRNIISFKISNFRPGIIKAITYDMLLLHDKLRFNIYQYNGNHIREHSSSPLMSHYLKFLENEELVLLNKRNEMSKFIGYLDTEHILSTQLQVNTTVYCVMVKLL